MKLETIYTELLKIINNGMSTRDMKNLLEKLEQKIREETCYKSTSKTRINAIKRIASKYEDKIALTGYGICNDYKVVTDSYHLIAIKQEDMPLKLVTTDKELVKKYGKENCIYQIYPEMNNIINFNKDYYNTIKIDYDDIAQFYKLHNKYADKELYSINDDYYNIKYLKNVIDVLGTNLTIYQSQETCRPLYLINENNELGIVLPIRKY